MGSAGKAQLSNMYALLVISSLMFDGRDPNDILELAADSVSSLSQSTVDAAYRKHLRKQLQLDPDPKRSLYQHEAHRKQPRSRQCDGDGG